MLLLVILITTIHLVLVGVGAVSPLVNIFYEWLESGSNSARYKLGNRLARFGIVAWVTGALFGLILGLISWSDSLSGSLQRLESKVNYGIIEYFFSLVLMVVYLAWRQRVENPGGVHRAMRCLIPLAAGSNSIYHFPVLFTVIGELQRRGLWNGEMIGASQFRQEWLVESIVWARTTHVVFAAVAFTGLVVLMIASRAEREEDESLYRVAALAGARLALVGVLGQVISGFWLIMTLESRQQSLLMGGDLWATSAFAGGVFLAFVWLHLLGLGIISPLKAKAVSHLALIGMFSMLLMVTATHRSKALTMAAGNAGNATASASELVETQTKGLLCLE
ncbi:MAG: hypothetical protein VB878_10090 [Pirellulaceae bacterium]